MAMQSSIKEWPYSERPRERLLQMGPAALSDAELLAIVIGNGNAASGMNAVETARALLKEFSSFQGMENTGIEEFRKIKGIGRAKSAVISAVFEISRRLNSVQIKPGAPILSSHDVYKHFWGRLTKLGKEHFYILMLNSKNRMIREELVSVGSLTASLVHPREVFLPAIRNSSAAVLFLHNHPSGDPSPSMEDKLITSRLVETGEIIGIRVLDHIIIGSEGYYSFADAHELKNNNKMIEGGS